ncbi:hypothetical protein RT717_10895 [Imperialibacter roseus]|uniref:Nucleotidyltransferase n=1 Tax=Imperialibacter roseus TaxID=1324217 RepID=A0ABZ0IZN1_9BACT|nr:hypothetical protein [Imperialibacter roseus]WOK09142.1 hypothetical protein RT717_10895 [Imperialibacter roseus]
MKNEEAILEKHQERRKEIREFLQAKYGNKIHSPFDSGSYAKHTAINTKFDLDLVVPFKRNSFPALREMYDDVFKELREEYKKLAVVREQKVSIGLEFYGDTDGQKVNIDVVPGRELNQDQYLADKKLNLYVRKTYGQFEEGAERLRTNIHAQIDNIRKRAEAAADIRKVIRLLKVWKVRNNGNIKSFLIELITIKAFDSKDMTGNIWDKLQAVLEFIRDNIETITLVDPGNGGNNVSETLSDFDKKSIRETMGYILDRIGDNEENITYYFPINEKFPCNEEKGKYGIKEAGLSIPPATKFG